MIIKICLTLLMVAALVTILIAPFLPAKKTKEVNQYEGTLFSMLVSASMVIAIILSVTVGKVITYDDFVAGKLKVYSWSNVEQLNAELAKGWEIEKTYNITNMVLRKKSKE